MTDAKLRMMILALLAVMIGCGRGDEETEKETEKDAGQQSLVKQATPKGVDVQSRVKKYAPKDAVTVICLDVEAARGGLVDALKKYPREAKDIKLDVVAPVLEKIDAIVAYPMPGDGPLFPVIVIYGEARPDDLTDVFNKLFGTPGVTDLRLKSTGNGRYEVEESPLPILVIDGREADDLDGDVLVVGMAPMLTAGFVGALGKGECPAVTLALEKSDTSAMLWGGTDHGEEHESDQSKSGIFSMNLTGDKLFRLEMTYENEEVGAEGEKKWRKKVQVFGSGMALKRSGATIMIENTGSGNLADLLVPSIRKEVEEANQAACKSNLFGIGARCAMFQAEDKDVKHPESLKVLIDMHLLHPSALKCPSDESQRACSYLYVAPSPGAAGKTLVACDLKGNHKDIRNVTFVSGAAGRMTETEFQAALKLPRNAAFATALAKAGG